ncbi:MAG: hypothetical protein IJM15_06340 [Erysipelotrichaceae bacterium]|nr:hypothetical protein [Erysipelotrichaceae bacterium]
MKYIFAAVMLIMALISVSSLFRLRKILNSQDDDQLTAEQLKTHINQMSAVLFLMILATVFYFLADKLKK